MTLLTSLLLVCSLFHGRAWAQSVIPVNGVSVLYDPGPRYRCYIWYEEGGGGLNPNPDKGTECAPFQTTDRIDDNCASFGQTINGRPVCPTWRFDTYGYYYQPANGGASQLGATPGYGANLTGGSGSPITVSLRNSARDFADCDLREVTFSYEWYASSFIKYRRSDGVFNTLDLASHFVVEFDVLIERDSSALAPAAKCPYQRRYLTTDWIYWYPDGTQKGRTNVLSINHFNPTNRSLPWSETTTNPPGCRLMIALAAVAEGVQTHVSLDFKQLMAQYGSQLCHPDGVPAGTEFQALQIVTSNVASNSIVRVSNINAQLANATTSLGGGSGTAPAYGQCAGSEWTGPTTCPTGWTCRAQNQYYSQCLP